MSWHARWGNPDPYAKPARAGDRFGPFVVLGSAKPDPHYGHRARVQCSSCGAEFVRVLAALRHNPPRTHRGCSAAKGGRAA